MERDFKGVWIPKELYLTKELLWTDKVLWIEVNSLDRGNGCFASNAYLSNKVDLTPNRISAGITTLKKKNLITEISFDGRKRVLKTHPENIKYLTFRISRIEANKIPINSTENTQGYSTELVRTTSLNNHNNTSITIQEEVSSSNTLKSINKEDTQRSGERFHSHPLISKETFPTLNLKTTQNQKMEKTDYEQLTQKKEKKIYKLSPTSFETEIIDYWNSLGLRNHIRKNSNIYNEIISKLKNAKDGRLFNKTKEFADFKNKKFTKEEIKLTINRFANSALDPNYWPSIGSFKTYLKNISLASFLVNPMGTSTMSKSFFVHFYKNESKLLENIIQPRKVKNVESTNKMVNEFKRFYEKNILGSISPEYTVIDENRFVEACQRTAKFFDKHEDRVLWVRGGDRLIEAVQFVCEAIMNDVREENLNKVTISWFSSDKTFNYRLPAYLNKESLLIEDQTENYTPLSMFIPEKGGDKDYD